MTPTLKAVGFSRQKTRYGRELAQAILSGSLDLDGLATLEDDAVRRELMQVVGIGRWTADIYLLMALCRPDVWPAGDLALAVAAQRALDLPSLPNPAEMEALGEAWRPWRAVAARAVARLPEPQRTRALKRLLRTGQLQAVQAATIHASRRASVAAEQQCIWKAGV